MSPEPSAIEIPESDDAAIESGPDRRTLFKAAAVIAVPAVGVGIISACSSNSAKTSTGSTGGSGGNGSPIAVALSSIPVGGGTVVSGVVVTQPTAGTYKAFSAVCTHAGCLVNKVQQGQILCPCHGSVYSATDGSVLGGPAPAPLTQLTATVKGADVDVTSA